VHRSFKATSASETITVGGWPKGVYLIRISNGATAKTLKMSVH
jgi:hypothetical protein